MFRRTVQVTCALLLVVGAGVDAARAQNAESSTGICGADASRFVPGSEHPEWNGWGGSPAQHRFQPGDRAGLSPEAVPRLRLKWAFGFSGATQAYAQPAVVGGRVFAGSATGQVYALDAGTGCQHWAFEADAPVRTAITIGGSNGAWHAYFGDLSGNLYAVDAASGTLVWKVEIDAHPQAIMTAAPVLAAGTLYVPMSSTESGAAALPGYACCTFRGSVSAVDAASGRILWKTYTIAEEPTPVRRGRAGQQLSGPSGAAVWSAPVVDLRLGRVYAVTGNSYSDPVADTSDAFLAFDAKTGRLLWSRQMTKGDGFTVDCDFPEAFRSSCPEANGPDFDMVSPMLLELGGGRRALVAGSKSGLVHAVDPDGDGAVLWEQRVGKGSRLGGVHWGLASDSRYVFAANSDVVVVPVLDGTPGAQKSPFGSGSMLLSPSAGGGLFALAADTGRIAWHTPHPGCGGTPGCSPAQSAAVTAMPGVVFSGGLDGHLRAYDAESGRIIWDVDTAREYQTVNGVPARGGALDGPGPVVAGGMLFVNSGYAFAGSMPGNVLLAFSVEP